MSVDIVAMPTRVTKIRVFVASPGDVAEERERLARAIERLNRTLGQAESIVLELVRWETHAWPGFGEDAQDVINQEIDTYDLFVGVMWKRLGTPTHRAESGTVEEFERAYDLWEQHRVPLLMFYFSHAPFSPTLDELDQVNAVLRFKRLLEARGALYWEYQTPEEFEAAVHEHVYQQVRRLVALADSQQLNRSLTDRGLTLGGIAADNRSLDDVAATGEIHQLLSSLLERIERLDAAYARRHEGVPPTVLLEVAHGLIAARKWAQAAEYFDRYVKLDANDWDVLFARAVAHANAHGGRASNISALRAYNDAIALRPSDIGENLVARLFSYRAAMLKRLGRLEEAEADLRIAAPRATASYEVNDILYNFACIYAMTGRRAEALQAIASLRGTGFIAGIRANRGGYFSALADDSEFLELVAPPR